uniref:Lipocalin/cytosolic fatty-acid binding domain-containing protein n=1 Tax=viral metagenome TaxID=1070528 RepID=A0A6C0BCB3_9ZZZZ
MDIFDIYKTVEYIFSLYSENEKFPTSLPKPFIQEEDTVDLEKYAGKWFEVARFQAPFELFMDNVETNYTDLKKDEDGKNTIKVVNTGKFAGLGVSISFDGTAYSTDSSNKNLKVSFNFNTEKKGDYNIIMLGPVVDEKYSYSVVRGDKYLWILSRTTTLPEKDEIISHLKDNGFSTEKFYFTKHN